MAKVLTLYEVNFKGVSLLPIGVALVIFIKACEWFRKDGDGVLKKDGRFRYLSSYKIHRILAPDTLRSEELFIVVRDVFQTSQRSCFGSMLAKLVGNTDLKQCDASAQRVVGTDFCFNLKHNNK